MPNYLVIILSILYGSISVITVLGNFLVILVIIKNKHMQTVTNFFIANLSVGDVMIGIFSIPFQFQAALLQRWILPDFLCPVAPFVKELTVNVSVITLTIISIDRYFAVLHPLKPRCSRRVAKVGMSIVWIFSLVSGIPTAMVFRVGPVPMENGGHKPFCQAKFPELDWVDLAKTYNLYLAIVQYFFPLCIICYSYFRIMHRIWLTKAPGSAVENRDQIMNRNKRKVSHITTLLYCFVECLLIHHIKIYLHYIFAPTKSKDKNLLEVECLNQTLEEIYIMHFYIMLRYINIHTCHVLYSVL